MARFSQNTKVAALKESPLFEGLSRKQLAQLARLTDDLDVPAGTVLCEEGKRGRVVLRDHRRVVRTATVTGATPLRFLVVSDQAFKAVLEIAPNIERKVLRTLIRRLVSASGDPTQS